MPKTVKVTKGEKLKNSKNGKGVVSRKNDTIFKEDINSKDW